MAKAPSTSLPRLLYFGEVPVESSYHGSALLHRLLSSYPAGKLRIFERGGRASQIERRLGGVGYREIRSAWTHGARSLRKYLPLLYWPVWKLLASLWSRRAFRELGDFRPEAILTVQEGTVWLAAYSLAQRLKVPCHLIVHDDWLREVEPGSSLARILEQRFRRIYRGMASRLLVSPFMEELFEKKYGAKGDLLYPSRSADVPRFTSPPPAADRPPRPFTIAFGGSGFDGGYLQVLVTVAEALGEIGGRLLLFGPITPAEKEAGPLNLPNVALGGLLPFAEMIQRFRTDADALLVPMSFAPDERRNMTVSFPSKLADYTAAGVPVLVFGPDYSSAVQWAKKNAGCCEVVDRDDRAVLSAALWRLSSDAGYRERLGTQALELGARYFSFESAQALFFSKLMQSSQR